MIGWAYKLALSAWNLHRRIAGTLQCEAGKRRWVNTWFCMKAFGNKVRQKAIITREHGESTESRFSSLDGLRGIAFLFVFLSHTASNSGMIFSGAGKLGVWLFFVLSSFLLTTYFLKDIERSRNPNEWLNYIMRRFLRIYPLYIIALTYDFLLTANKPSVFLQHLILQAGEGHFWTIPVEFKYYFILPFVVFLIIYLCRRNIIRAC